MKIKETVKMSTIVHISLSEFVHDLTLLIIQTRTIKALTGCVTITLQFKEMIMVYKKLLKLIQIR